MEKEFSGVIIGTILRTKIEFFWNIIFLAISAFGHIIFLKQVVIRN